MTDTAISNDDTGSYNFPGLWARLRNKATRERVYDVAATLNQQLQDSGTIGNIYNKCCLDEREEPFYSPVIQERTWTSPTWHQPGG